MKKAFGVDAELEPGGGGVFDVTVDGQLLFSKHAEGDRFPHPGEVEKLIRATGAA
ncbi:MAG: Rdx family protein [Planctomycetes bacterium]|nr:Rdx family protein [Planctomycetota bacterium]